MKIKEKMKKISFAIPVKIITAIAGMMVLLCVILVVMLSRLTNNLITKQIQFLANENAQIATEYLETMLSQAKALSSEFSRYELLDQDKKVTLIKQALISSLDDSRIFSAYAAFEPNTLLSDTPDGRSYYAYRSGDSILMDTYNDYDTYSTGDYYAVSKETLEPHITEPYSYQLSNGETVWLITISNPIFDESGDFIGVANCDILTDTLNNLDYNLNDYKTAYSYILTNNANYVTHTSDDSLFGTAFTEEDTAVFDAISNGTQLSKSGINSVFGGDAYEVYVPLSIQGINQNWSSAFVVSKTEALASERQIVFLIIILAAAGLVVLAVMAAVMLKRALKPVGDIVQFAKELGKGNLFADLNISENNELGEIASSLKRTATGLGIYIQEISEVLGEISRCNLNVSVQREFYGDFIPIKTALEEIIRSLNVTMKQIDIASKQVSDGASQVSMGAQALSQGATEQAATIEELSASIQEISDGVQNNAENVHMATQYVKQAADGVDDSNSYMKQMLRSMDEINQSSGQINNIIKVIDDIAFQTNILALNAAVEAARAGAAGKGFAVVAEEVRNLASKSAEAAKQTSALIEGSIQKVTEGLSIAEKTAQSLDTVIERAMQVSNIIEKIDQASSQQATAISQMNQGLTQVSMVIQTNSATAEESAAASEELSGQSEVMHNEVAKFTLKAEDN